MRRCFYIFTFSNKELYIYNSCNGKAKTWKRNCGKRVKCEKAEKRVKGGKTEKRVKGGKAEKKGKRRKKGKRGKNVNM